VHVGPRSGLVIAPCLRADTRNVAHPIGRLATYPLIIHESRKHRLVRAGRVGLSIGFRYIVQDGGSRSFHCVADA
jgi:hypothetical protein